MSEHTLHDPALYDYTHSFTDNYLVKQLNTDPLLELCSIFSCSTEYTMHIMSVVRAAPAHASNCYMNVYFYKFDPTLYLTNRGSLSFVFYFCDLI